jgi:hypothetical protein
VPGVNTARCNCPYPNALSFEWTLRDGRRVLEPAPQHDAPAEDCECGLYAWGRPRSRWALDPELASGELVCGAVASWGQLQVHHDGIRAQHACVTVLTYPRDTQAEAMRVLERVAARYRVELVPLDELEAAASRHASPLPDSVYPEAPAPITESLPDLLPPRPASATPVPTVERPVRNDRLGLVLLFLFILVPVSIGRILFLGHNRSIILIGTILWVIGGVGVGWVFHHFWPSLPRQRRARRQQDRTAFSEDEFRAIEDALDKSQTAKGGQVHSETS